MQGGSKLERARDLFEQCLDGCPPKFAKSTYIQINYYCLFPFSVRRFMECISSISIPPSLPDIFLLYAQLEEKHGLARHAMAIYNRATKAVDKEDQYAVSNGEDLSGSI